MYFSATAPPNIVGLPPLGPPITPAPFPTARKLHGRRPSNLPPPCHRRSVIAPNRTTPAPPTFFLARRPQLGYNYVMSIDIDATYRDGVIYPAVPLSLPDNTPVRVRVVPLAGRVPPIPFPTSREKIDAIRPKSPRFTAEQLQQLIDKYGVSVGSLPENFSREDIYSDHD